MAILRLAAVAFKKCVCHAAAFSHMFGNICCIWFRHGFLFAQIQAFVQSVRMKNVREIVKLRQSLLTWYDSRGRTLPWRIRPEDRKAGARADPYRVWLAEVMCQQTTVAAVTPYWYKFLRRWSSISDLAKAELDDILTAWAGLGYYARARNLHTCAQVVTREFGGEFPRTEKELLKLPGIGPYTAAAIVSICFCTPANVVDGNVERVIARLRQVETPLPKAHPEIRALAGQIADPDRPGDYAQGLMDLGNMICKPRRPQCKFCPWVFTCVAAKSGIPEAYPKRQTKAKKPVRYGAVFYLEHEGRVHLSKRPEKGLLGGMMVLPGTDWTHEVPPEDVWMACAPVLKNWEKLEDTVRHVFTHFTLRLTVFRSTCDNNIDGIWADIDGLDKYALPSVMRKVIKIAQAE